MKKMLIVPVVLIVLFAMLSTPALAETHTCHKNEKCAFAMGHTCRGFFVAFADADHAFIMFKCPGMCHPKRICLESGEFDFKWSMGHANLVAEKCGRTITVEWDTFGRTMTDHYNCKYDGEFCSLHFVNNGMYKNAEVTFTYDRGCGCSCSIDGCGTVNHCVTNMMINCLCMCD